jgi:hypothetical protein
MFHRPATRNAIAIALGALGLVAAACGSSSPASSGMPGHGTASGMPGMDMTSPGSGPVSTSQAPFGEDDDRRRHEAERAGMA